MKSFADVQALYDSWLYPCHVVDLEAGVANGLAHPTSPHVAFSLLFPDKKPSKLRILDAGCGSLQAALLAYLNPDCEVLGIDLSTNALQHQRKLQKKHNLRNLSLLRCNLLEVGKLGIEFDLIYSTGVLHHLPRPIDGLRALKQVLRPQGAMQLMLYGKYVRTGVYMMQELFRLLDVDHSQEGVNVVRKTIAALPDKHFVHAYKAGELINDAAIVDTFLHCIDQAYDVQGVLDLVDEAGMQFQCWQHNQAYYPNATLTPASDLGRRVRALPREQQWCAMELISQSHGCHRFVLRHRQLESRRIHIQFQDDDFLQYIPSLHPAVRHLPAEKPGLHRYHSRQHVLAVPAVVSQLLERADGKRSVAEIINGLTTQHQHEHEKLTFCRKMLRELYLTEYLRFATYGLASSV